MDTTEQSGTEEIAWHDCPSDIRNIILSFSPTQWYTVNKSSQKLAEFYISTSAYARALWDNLFIPCRAIDTGNYAICNIFLRNKFKVSFIELQKIPGIPGRFIEYLLSHSYVRENMSTQEVLICLSMNPDATVSNFQVHGLSYTDEAQVLRLFSSNTHTSHDIIVSQMRFDLLKTHFNFETLPNYCKAYIFMYDHIQGESRETQLRELFVDLLVTTKITRFMVLIPYLRTNSDTIKVRRFFDLLYSVCDEWSVNQEALLFVLEYGITLRYLPILESIVVNNNAVKEIMRRLSYGDALTTHEHVEVMKQALLTRDDYSSITSDLWKYLNPSTLDVFTYLYNHGYREHIAIAVARLVRLNMQNTDLWNQIHS